MDVSTNQGQALTDALNKLFKLSDTTRRRKVMRKVAGYMAKMNRKRMRANVAPDGHAMQKRSGISHTASFKEYMRDTWKSPVKKAGRNPNNSKPLEIYLSKIKKAKRKMFYRHVKENGKESKGMGSVLREAYESDKAEAFFNGAIGKTALDHQLGRGADPVRELLGLPQADQDAIQKIIEDNLLNVT